MVQKQSMLVPVDKSGIWLVRTIHTYTKLSKIQHLGGFGKFSVRECSPNSWLQKKKKRKFLLVRAAQTLSFPCGKTVGSSNGALLLKKRLTPVGRRVAGYISKKVNRKRAIASFITIL